LETNEIPPARVLKTIKNYSFIYARLCISDGQYIKTRYIFYTFVSFTRARRFFIPPRVARPISFPGTIVYIVRRASVLCSRIIRAVFVAKQRPVRRFAQIPSTKFLVETTGRKPIFTKRLPAYIYFRHKTYKNDVPIPPSTTCPPETHGARTFEMANKNDGKCTPGKR